MTCLKEKTLEHLNSCPVTGSWASLFDNPQKYNQLKKWIYNSPLCGKRVKLLRPIFGKKNWITHLRVTQADYGFKRFMTTSKYWLDLDNIDWTGQKQKGDIR